MGRSAGGRLGMCVLPPRGARRGGACNWAFAVPPGHVTCSFRCGLRGPHRILGEGVLIDDWIGVGHECWLLGGGFRRDGGGGI